MFFKGLTDFKAPLRNKSNILLLKREVMAIFKPVSEILRNFLKKILEENQILSASPSLFLRTTPTGIIYRSAIAFQQGNSEITAQRWADDLIKSYLSKKSSPFILKSKSDGNLDCYPTVEILTDWLEQFSLDWLPWLISQQKTVNFLQFPQFNLFFCQYIHARCCSLRRLGENTKQFTATDQAISWLSTENELIITDPQEWALLRQWIHLSDRLSQASEGEILKLMTHLCESFWQFERYCRIFSDIRQEKKQISRIRLKMVAYTELILHGLLTQCLQVDAPTAL